VSYVCSCTNKLNIDCSLRRFWRGLEGNGIFREHFNRSASVSPNDHLIKGKLQSYRAPIARTKTFRILRMYFPRTQIPLTVRQYFFFLLDHVQWKARASSALGSCRQLQFKVRFKRAPLSTEASFLPPSTRVCAEGETPKSLISPLEDASNSALNGIERHDYPSRLFQNAFSSFLRM